jgi:hypothetical protein
MATILKVENTSFVVEEIKEMSYECFMEFFKDKLSYKALNETAKYLGLKPKVVVKKKGK